MIEKFLMGMITAVVISMCVITVVGLTTKQIDGKERIRIQLDRISAEDKDNPLCLYFVDEDGNGHGCLTDVQLYALQIIKEEINR